MEKVAPGLDAGLCAGVDPEYPYVGLLFSDPVSELNGQLRLANTAQADGGHTGGGLGASYIDFLQKIVNAPDTLNHSRTFCS